METYFIKFHQKIAFDDFRVSWPLNIIKEKIHRSRLGHLTLYNLPAWLKNHLDGDDVAVILRGLEEHHSKKGNDARFTNSLINGVQPAGQMWPNSWNIVARGTARGLANGGKP